MKPHEKTVVLFLLRHLALGASGGFAFGAVLLGLDFANLFTLIRQSEEPFLWLLMLFFGLFVTFGSAGMGVGIMSLAEDDH